MKKNILEDYPVCCEECFALSDPKKDFSFNDYRSKVYICNYTYEAVNLNFPIDKEKMSMCVFRCK